MIYKMFFRGSLVTVAIGTALGVSALWIPNAWHDTAWRLFYSDVVLFVGAIGGSIISHYGAKHDK